MFFKIVVLKSFAIFTGKRLCWSLFLIKLHPRRAATLLERDSTQVFSSEYCKIFKSSFFRERLPWLLLRFRAKFCEKLKYDFKYKNFKTWISSVEVNLLEWQSFYDQFNISIHQNKILNDIDRFNYLRRFLAGQVLEK